MSMHCYLNIQKFCFEEFAETKQTPTTQSYWHTYIEFKYATVNILDEM